MKLITTVAPLLVLLFACKLCSLTGDTKRFDPYQGSVADLLPKNTSVSGAKLSQDSLTILAPDKMLQGESAKNAKSAARAEYTYTVSGVGVFVKIRSLLINYDSAEAADAAIRDAAQRDNGTLQPKTKNGRTVGQRYVGDNGKAIIWSDGSLVCQISSTMSKPVENFEAAMPF